MSLKWPSDYVSCYKSNNYCAKCVVFLVFYRKFSLINEEDEDDSDMDDLGSDVQTVKESRSAATWVAQVSTYLYPPLD